MGSACHEQDERIGQQGEVEVDAHARTVWELDCQLNWWAPSIVCAIDHCWNARADGHTGCEVDEGVGGR